MTEWTKVRDHNREVQYAHMRAHQELWHEYAIAQVSLLKKYEEKDRQLKAKFDVKLKPYPKK